MQITLESCVSRLLLSIDMPDDVIRQTDNSVTGTLGHLSKSFRLGLVLEGVAWEVDSWAG